MAKAEQPALSFSALSVVSRNSEGRGWDQLLRNNEQNCKNKTQAVINQKCPVYDDVFRVLGEPCIMNMPLIEPVGKPLCLFDGGGFVITEGLPFKNKCKKHQSPSLRIITISLCVSRKCATGLFLL